MKKIVWITGFVLVAAVAGYGFLHKSMPSSSFTTSTIERGTLERVITASGTLSPVMTVEVGTQVSGTIDAVLADFNDVVQRGQLLAVLDTTLLKMNVIDAEANRDKALAQLAQADNDYSRDRQLFEQGLLSNSEMMTSAVAADVQQATLQSAMAALQRAQRNLDYAYITSPIAGTVIQRSVEAGQTVAASLSTPTLFTIVEDLAKMEILVQVDESDIGQIVPGQTVRFDVQAYPDEQFAGTVSQVRLQPTEVSNVINYTVVVTTKNDAGVLLPGMTATVDFIISQHPDVLLVSNTALRFQPSDDLLKQVRKQHPPKPPEGAPQPPASRGERVVDSAEEGGSISIIWLLNEEGQLHPAPVRLGMSDGRQTEILDSREDLDGVEVVIAQASGETTGTQEKNSRMFSSPGGGPGGPPPPF